MTKIFIIAGEASGDALGASLITALKNQVPDLDLQGVGGDLMLAAGLGASVFPMTDLSVMGVAEVLPKVPLILGRIKETDAAIAAFDPDIVLTIDAPDFSFRVQKKVMKRGLRAQRIHYVAPTVWAWRPGRAKKIAAFLNGLICLLPFEPPYFEREGLKSIAVGHPVLQSPLAGVRNFNAHEYRTIGLFFGSRRGEVDRHLSLFTEAAKIILQDEKNLRFIAPTLPHHAAKIAAHLTQNGIDAEIVTDPDQKIQAFKRCDAAIAVSGTVGLELAVAGVPHVIAYKMNPLTHAILKHMIKTPYAHLVNILLGRMAIPEFIQDAATPQNLARSVRAALKNPESQKRAFAEAVSRLQPDPTKNAADLAAAFIKSFIKNPL